VNYYIDTCIWFDYLENRNDNLRPLGDFAISLINKIIDEEGIFIFTDILMQELLKKHSQEKLNYYLKIIPSQLIKNVKINKNQLLEANKLNKILKISLGDVLHAIIARDNYAILISRDKHFQEIDFIKCFKPEDLI
jgi:predicted nucleic acid-binding protein